MNGATSFENDLFLSYANLDDEPLMEGQRGWVSDFRHTLEVRLAQLLGEKPKVWWDRSGLRGNDALAETLVVELGKVALLVPVLTPAYLKSDWCKRELATFHGDDDVSRIFKVLKTPVVLEEHPEPLRSTIGYEFYRYDTDTGRFREMHQDSSPEDRLYYKQKVDDLAQDICERIRRMQGEAPTPPKDPVTVFLAESTWDVREERDLLLRALRQRPEVTVLPSAPLPSHGPGLRQRVEDDVARCRLSIHVLGGNYGTVPEAETLSAAEIQNEAAARRSASDPGFSRLIWMPPGLALADERQRDFLDRLRTDSDAQRGAEILHKSLEDLETVISDNSFLVLQPPCGPRNRRWTTRNGST